MPSYEAVLRVERLEVRYGSRERPALDGVSLRVSGPRTLAVVGPSGAGKTTLLRAISGLLRAQRGDVLFDERSIVRDSAQCRRIGVVFAEDALLPHRTVRGNLAFVARDRASVAGLAKTLGIDGLLERRPAELSSGERRRVSIARALLARPQALLLDEPLAPLDPELRAIVREELLHVRERFDGPMIVVTHDHADAMTFADELAVLVDGRIEDTGTPQRVYDYPSTVRAASFLGTRPMNLLPGPALGEAAGIVVGIRPERVRIGAEGRVRGTVVRVERTGADAYVCVQTPNGAINARIDGRYVPSIGDALACAFDDADVRRFDRGNGAARA